MCGPTVFMADVSEALTALGVEPDPHPHRDLRRRTRSNPRDRRGCSPPAPHLPLANPVLGLPVAFARSGITAAWDPRYSSVLELAEACDVPVRWSCRTGVCHSCDTAVLSGGVRYEP